LHRLQITVVLTTFGITVFVVIAIHQ